MTPPAPLRAPYRPKRPAPHATMREAYAFAARYLHPPRLAAGAGACVRYRGTVLVMPTWLRDDRQTAALRAMLRGHGFDAQPWSLGRNMGPTPRLMDGAQARLLALSDAHGPIDLLGFSMGGLFARWLALRHPARVRQAIMVCSPWRAPLESFFLPLGPLVRMQWSARDVRAMAAELQKPLSVPATYVFGRRDGLVAWQSCSDPLHPEDCFEIGGPHVTIAVDPEVWSIVLRRLSRATHPHPAPLPLAGLG